MARLKDAYFLAGGRFKILTVSVFIIGILIIGRLFKLQVLDRSFYSEKVNTRSASSYQALPANRGRIFVYEGKNLYPLAVNIDKYNLIASPAEIENLDEWVGKMAPFLDIEEILSRDDKDPLLLIQEGQDSDKLKLILTRLSQKNDFYELLKKDIDIEEVEAITDSGVDGIKFETVPKRYYPEGSLFSHLIGFVSQGSNCSQKDSQQCVSGEGQYGLEEFFDDELSGIPGESKLEMAPGGYLITSPDNIIKPPKNGIDLVLTVNRSIQFFICQTLEEAIKEYQADSGSIIVINPKTGAILGLCNKPSFDPNRYFEQENFALFKDSCVASTFEPGSVFKVITMAAALDTKEVTPETSYNDEGSVQIEDYTITNAGDRVYGTSTMTNVLEKSINTGAVFAARLVGRERFRNYLKKFGFGSLTGIELSGESVGDISNLEEKSETYLATSSFGHGISVTPLQIVNAIAAIANSGKLMKPYIVDSLIEDGYQNVRAPQFVRQAISSSTAAALTAMMVSVLENGYGRQAKVDGYYVAGKTGTAQIPKQGGGYSEKVIHSFVGFAPATNPRFAAFVKLDNPKKGEYAESTATPTFGKIADFILKYYNVPPDREH